MLDLARHEARRSTKTIELTAKEFALLEYLMRNPGCVLTRSAAPSTTRGATISRSQTNVVDIYVHYPRNRSYLAATPTS